MVLLSEFLNKAIRRIFPKAGLQSLWCSNHGYFVISEQAHISVKMYSFDEKQSNVYEKWIPWVFQGK